MASFLLSNLSLISLSPTPKPHSKSKSKSKPKNFIPIRCGPRSNRGPLLKGRTLSSEAIQAVQSLKRSHRRSNGPNSLSKTLSRLIKSDLIAAFKELVRQDHLDLAVLVFSAVRSEYGTDLTAYADLVSGLDRGKRPDDIDRLIVELELGGDRQGWNPEVQMGGGDYVGLSPPSSFSANTDGNERGFDPGLSPPSFFCDNGSDRGSNPRLSSSSSFSMDTDGSDNGSDIGSNPRLSLPSSFSIDRDGSDIGYNPRVYTPSSISIMYDADGNDNGSDIGSKSRLSPPGSFFMDDTDGDDMGFNPQLSPPSSFSMGSSSRLSRPGSFPNDKDRKEGVIGFGDSRGLVKLVKALIAAGRGESTVRIYEMMKRSGWGSDQTVEDEYLGRVLERGFKRFGEERLAKEVGDMFGGVLEKEMV